jgi:hypothetical protein
METGDPRMQNQDKDMEKDLKSGIEQAVSKFK